MLKVNGIICPQLSIFYFFFLFFTHLNIIHRYCLKHGIIVKLFLFYRYLNNRVYVSLANGDICIYYPDTSKYMTIPIVIFEGRSTTVL